MKEVGEWLKVTFRRKGVQVESKVVRLFELFGVVVAGGMCICVLGCQDWVVYILCSFASLKSSPILCDYKSFISKHSYCHCIVPPYAS